MADESQPRGRWPVAVPPWPPPPLPQGPPPAVGSGHRLPASAGPAEQYEGDMMNNSGRRQLNKCMGEEGEGSVVDPDPHESASFR